MKNHLIATRTFPVLIAASLVCSHAHAQDFESTIDTKASSANIDSMIVLESTGSLIGDFDSESNPDGTQTRSGLFGGSGNQTVDTSVSTQADTTLDTNPAGSFTISPDFDLNTLEIDGLAIDLLNGSPSGTDLSVTLLYNSFHTVSPSFLYPGGVPITLPLGQIGGISQAVLTQTTLGAGTITPTANPDVFDITVLVSAQLDMIINTSLPGQDPNDIPIDALPIVLPIAGQIEMTGTNSVSVTLDIAPDAIMFETPIDGVSLPDIPFELPTFGSDTASVIFTPTPEGISIDALLSLTLVASGELATCPADLTGDGNLNFFDVSAFLGAFAAMEPAADFTGDGQYNFFDVSAFLNAFSAGCP